MAKCKHRGTSWESRKLDGGHWLSFRQCRRCWAWLALGSSNDATAVRVEIRAVEVADAAFRDPRLLERLDRGSQSGREAWGWYARANGSAPRGGDLETAGYLAHAIATHDEEQA